MPQDAPPQLGYTPNPLDRVHTRRKDERWVNELATRPDALAVVLAEDRPLYSTSGNPKPCALFSATDGENLAPDSEVLFLGLDETERPVFARQAPALGEDETSPAPGVESCNLRAFAMNGVVPAPEVAIVALARSLLAWHKSHSFCSACGQPSDMALGGYRRDCPSCNAQHFPRTDPVTIMLITDGDRALLARSPHFPPGMYSAIAGFMEPGETIEDAVARETWEETGLKVGQVRYHMSQPWPFPSSLMIACYAQALTTELNIDTEELEDARWVTRGELGDALRGEAEFSAPAPFAIAHHLVRGFVDGG